MCSSEMSDGEVSSVIGLCAHITVVCCILNHTQPHISQLIYLTTSHYTTTSSATWSSRPTHLVSQCAVTRAVIRLDTKTRNLSRVFLHHTLAVAEVMVAFEVACRS